MDETKNPQEQSQGCCSNTETCAGGEKSRHEHSEEYSGQKWYSFTGWGWPVKQLGFAATGACALAKEEAESIFQRLVERGKAVTEGFTGKSEPESQETAEGHEGSGSWIKNFWEKGRQQTKETVQNAVGMSFESIEKVLDKMNIPKKSDLDELSRRVDALTEKIETLKNSNTFGA